MTLRFGGLTSLSEVDLRLDRDEILAVIGPDGPGGTAVAATGVCEAMDSTQRDETEDETRETG